jgi:putative oxidoreductase
MPSVFIFFGRLCLSLHFIFGAYWHIASWGAALTKIAATGIGYPSFVLIIATLLLGIGGVCLLLGFYTRLVAALLILEVFFTALLFHPFWNVGGTEFFLVFPAFLSRAAICGGLFILLASGPGSISVDARNRGVRRR